jgi:hypothetical protein
MKCEVRRVLPHGEATIRFEIYDEGETEPYTRVCAIDQLNGKSSLKPKALLSLFRGELALLEGVAKEAGCAEMRFVGRFTQKMFPDYEQYTTADEAVGLRKRLT